MINFTQWQNWFKAKKNFFFYLSMIFLHQIAGSLPHSQTRVTWTATTADRARGGEGVCVCERDR